MKVFRAGQYSITLSDPSPVWISIVDQQGRTIEGKAEDLQDLQYIINRAVEYMKNENV